jgi:hypothetical protein
MFPTLRHIPPKAIVHIPGPPRIGTKRSIATWGVRHADAPAPEQGGGFPTGDMIQSYVLNTPSHTAPVWFAVSDGGAGFIPWGSWQVAIYLAGTPLPPSENLAFGFTVAHPGDVGASVAGQAWAKLQQLRAQAVSAGYPNAAKISITQSAIWYNTPPFPNFSAGLVAPPGVNLSVFYEGPLYYEGEGQPYSMVEAQPGYDNPLMLALWSPGNRAILRANEPAGPGRYPRYPYPYPPYYGPTPPT